MYVYTEVGLQD